MGKREKVKATVDFTVSVGPPQNPRQMEAWIDHHPDNLVVLCDVHRRHKGAGIHAITGPIWRAQVLRLERYELGSQETLKAMRTMIRTK